MNQWYRRIINRRPRPTMAEPIYKAPKPGAARERLNRRREDDTLPKVDWTWAVIGLALAGVIALVAVIALSATGNPTTSLAAADSTAQPQDGPPPAAGAFQAATLPPVAIKPWDGKQRVTILLMGIDKRPFEAGTSFRTDTLILLSVDPATQRIGMLSIPRDLAVPIPNHAELQSINTAYVLGELTRPGYGPRLAAETVEYNLGMRVDYYVVVEFQAVINLIDAIGGITVDVPKTIDDKEFPDLNTYGYDPLYIPAGRIEMNGMLALKYARTRHGDSDFERTQRQQQVLLAVRQKALRPEALPELVAKSGVIWNEVSKGVRTDMAFDQMLSLGWYVKDIPDGGLVRGAIEGPYIQAVTYKGYPALTINRETIANLLTNIFGADYGRR